MSLVSFARHNAFEFHPYGCIDKWFILYYCYMVFHCVDLYKVLLITSPLSCFQLFATVYKTGINISVSLSVDIYFLIF